MKISERAPVTRPWFSKLRDALEREDEITRLQYATLIGVLLGVWAVAAVIEFQYSTMVAASLITIGTASAIAIRVIT